MGIVFGPVPSRRLGVSLGVNNIPVKICTYSCVYCQIGRTIKMIGERKAFYEPFQIRTEVSNVLRKLSKENIHVDYISFVPDGEPTLDKNLGKEIELLRDFEIPIAVLTNSSLMSCEDVRNDLFEADLVSLKIDAVTEEIWKKVDRPLGTLDLGEILEGIKTFTRNFKGKVITETMLINSIDYKEEAEKIARFIAHLNVNEVYVAIPTRPPAEKWVKPPPEEVINYVYQKFAAHIGESKVKLLTAFEGTSFYPPGSIENALLEITSVHPMREDAVKELLEKRGVDWSLVEKMLKQGELIEIEYLGRKYYMRKLPTRR